MWSIIAFTSGIVVGFYIARRWAIVRGFAGMAEGEWKRRGWAHGHFASADRTTPILGEPTETVIPRLPRRRCSLCDMDTRHDLDGHCMVCDRCNYPLGRVEEAARGAA